MPTPDPQLIEGRQHLDQVVLAGIAKARVSLAIATADLKAMLLPPEANGLAASANRRHPGRSVLSLFRDLAKQGVEVRVLHGGIPSGPVLAELRKAALPKNLCLRRCPRMHAKAVVIDCQTMYLGSANLTGSGLGAKSPYKRNFELGLLTRQPALIDGVLAHFNSIWEGSHCPTCRRRSLCPIPLEQPDLAAPRPKPAPAVSSRGGVTPAASRQ